MSSGDYSESFTGWTSYAVNWNGLATNATGTIPSATRITAASTSIIPPSSSAGVQSTNTSTNLQFLSTGPTANTTSTGADLNLNFSGRNAGTISFAAAQVANSTGDRVGTLQVYYSTDGTAWTEITGTSLPFTVTNNVARSANISVSLPAALNNQGTVKLRFYYYNGPTAGNTGSRPKISIDDLLVTSTPSSGTPPVITAFNPASGAAGTVVTIGGSNFIGVTNVAFNGVAASFSNVTDTNLSATVPAGALSGPISVFTPSGVATTSNSFVVPTVSIVLPVSINEGESSFGEARINVQSTNDVEVTLASSSTSDLVVETPITIFAGTTNYTFSISAPSDSVIDGNTNVTVTPSAAGYAAAPGTIRVVNVDALKIPLTTFVTDSYTQNFDSLGTSTVSNVISTTTGVQSSLGSSVSTNLNGWFAAKIAGNGGIANIVADAGTGTSGAFYNYGNTNSPANLDRSLGTLATGSLTGAFGALVVNNTGETINSIIINLTGKFWRTSTTLQNTLTFGYGKIDGTTFNNNNFLSVANAAPLPSANVVGPAPVNPAIALNGNDPANQVAISNVAIPVQLLPGETMFFRWQDFDGGGSDAGLAIDNLSLSASTNLPLPIAGSVTVDQLTLSQTSATASSSVVTDSGASLTLRGFVYALSSVSSNPVIGGSNVVVLTNDPPEVSAFTNTLTGLTAATSYSIRSFVVNGAGTNYSAPVAFSTLPLPPSFGGVYTQSFNGFTNMAALPAGWRALSTSNINSYAGDWNASNSVAAGFYGRTNIPGVLGYLHTSVTGILSNTLTLVNNTGSTLTNLFVSYLGEVNTLNPTSNTRFPAWTVVVNGRTNPALAYSTASGSNEFKSAEITGLNVTNGGSIVVSWWSDRGTNATGSSRMIGMTDVRIATNAPSLPAINVSGTLTNFATTAGTASASQSFLASGSDLSGGITVSAPTSFEVSTNNLAFGSSVVLEQSAGSVPITPVFVRITAAAPLGAVSGSVSLASAGAIPQNVAVSGTVNQAGETFTNWAQGAPLNSANLILYAIGGASSPTATNGVAMSNSVTSSNLSITAIVRTNDPSLSVVGQAVTDLAAGLWNSNSVTMQPGDQTGVGEGLQRQIWSTPRNTDTKKFLRLQTTLSNQ